MNITISQKLIDALWKKICKYIFPRVEITIPAPYAVSSITSSDLRLENPPGNNTFCFNVLCDFGTSTLGIIFAQNTQTFRQCRLGLFEQKQVDSTWQQSITLHTLNPGTSQGWSVLGYTIYTRTYTNNAWGSWAISTPQTEIMDAHDIYDLL